MTDADERLPYTREQKKDALARKILGVPASASVKDIKKHFYMLAMEHHPDKAPMDKEREKRYRNMANAYEYLVRSGDDGIELFDPGDSPEEQKIGGYHSDNAWGYFLYWRDTFMDT